MSEFSFSVLFQHYTNLLSLEFTYKTPSLYIFSHKQFGRLETEDKYNKKINGLREKESFENYRNIKLDTEAPFPGIWK